MIVYFSDEPTQDLRLNNIIPFDVNFTFSENLDKLLILFNRNYYGRQKDLFYSYCQKQKVSIKMEMLPLKSGVGFIFESSFDLNISDKSLERLFNAFQGYLSINNSDKVNGFRELFQYFISNRENRQNVFGIYHLYGKLMFVSSSRKVIMSGSLDSRELK